MLVAARVPAPVRSLVIIQASPARNPNIVQDVRAILDRWPAHFATRDDALAFFDSDSPYSRSWVEGFEERDGFRAFSKEDMMESITDLAVIDYWNEQDTISCPTLVIRHG